MKNFKRIVGLLLCLAMVLSFVPVTHTHVHAAESEWKRVTVSNAIVGAYDDGTTQTNLIGQQNAAVIIDGDMGTQITIGNDNDGGTTGNKGAGFLEGLLGRYGWISYPDTYLVGNGGMYTPVSILTLEEETEISRVTIHKSVESDTRYTPTQVTVQVKTTGGTWETVADSVTTNTWPAVIDFAAAEAKEVRILAEKIVKVSSQLAHWQIPEIEVYEYEEGTEPTVPPATEPGATNTKITVSSAIAGAYDDGTTRKNFIGQQNAANIIDGKLDTNVLMGNAKDGGSVDGGWIWSESEFVGNGGEHTPAVILTLGQETVVNGVKVFAVQEAKKYTPSEMTVQVMSGSAWKTVATYNDNSWPAVINFPAESTTQIRILAEKIKITVISDENQWAYWQLPEVEVYGYVDAGTTDPTEPTTPSELGTTNVSGTPSTKKITISTSDVHACSLGATDSSDYSKLLWYCCDANPTWGKEDRIVDKSTESSSNRCTFGIGSSTVNGVSYTERADCYIDLSNGAGGYTNVSKFVLYHGGEYAVADVKVTLLLKDGTKQEKTLEPNWGTSLSSTPATWDLGENYKVTGIYVWESDAKGGSFGEIELYQIETVQLPQPENLQVIGDPTSNSFTVGANTVSAGGKLQFRRSGDNNWYDADGYSYTFTGLETGTTYTVEAQYVATGVGYITTVTPATITATTKANPLSAPENLEVSETETTITARADAIDAAKGTLMFRLLDANGEQERDWQAEGSFAELQPGTKYTVEAKYFAAEGYSDSPVTTKVTGTDLPVPVLSATKTDTTITATATPSTTTYGTLKFRLLDANKEELVTWTENGEFTGLTPSKTYYVEAKFETKDPAVFSDSDERTLEVTTEEPPCQHEYTDCEDIDCNLCSAVRVAPGHTYSNACDATCNVCGEPREVPDHVYTNECTDTECSVCGEVREAPGHSYDITKDCDLCVNCGYVNINSSHVYDDTCADSDCNVCGKERVSNHTYSNDCDTTCSECGYVRTDAGHVFTGNDGVTGTADDACDAICDSCGTVRKVTHVYADACDADCANCGQLRDAPHSIADHCAENQTCSICEKTFAEPLHVFTDVCDDICNVCGVQLKDSGRTHTFDNACDITCNRCGCVREAPHVFDSNYDNTCNSCTFTRNVLQKPTGLPSYDKLTKLELTAPVLGYYSNKNTNGAITDWYVDGNGPDELVDGIANDAKNNRAETKNYNYVELREGTKIPVILFTFGETVNVCKMNIYGYGYNYYNMEDFTVQVWTDEGWKTVAKVTNAFTEGVIDGEAVELGFYIEKPMEIIFDKAYETTQLRILVNDITNMYGRGDGTTGNDIFGYEAGFRVQEIEIYSTPVVVEQLDNVTINGAHISQYKIVYSEDEPDYNLTAAQYIQSAIYKKTGYTLAILEDDARENDCEILVGHTSRSFSSTLKAPGNNAMKFNINASGTKIAMEADYFIIAGAAYYFAQEYIPTASGVNITVPETLQTIEPIKEAPNNYIMLIGDGMGVNQTKLFDVYDVTDSQFTSVMDISDNEDIFYGYYFPHEGRSRTWNYLGQITDSGAGGTALSTGYKTINGFVGLDRYEREVKNLSELAMECGMSVAVMSTEAADGATPSDFSVHLNDRYGDVESLLGDFKGLMVNPSTDYSEYTEAEWNVWEPKVKSALNQVAADPDGFFIMYEEAFIDTNCHYGEPEEAFKTMYRFNQAIGIFMEYAMYNPDTFVLITADHETGGIVIDGQTVRFTEKNPPDEAAGSYKYNHSLLDVPVFAYGFGAEVFETDVEKGEFYQNASIGRTYAHFMTNGHADDFGDPWYPILVKNTVTEEYPEDPQTVKTSETLEEIDISGKVTGTYSQKVGYKAPATITINLTNADGTPTNIKKMVISAANTTSAAPATTIVEAQVEVDGELVWLQIYKDTLYTDAKQTGVLDFHTFYNAYQIKIYVNSLNSTSAYFGTVQLTDIELYGYNVVTPDLAGVVTSGGDENELADIKLMQNGVATGHKVVVTGNSYYVMDVAAGNYTVVATKNNHITVEYDITVGSEPVRQDVELKYVADTTTTGVSQSIRLIEPWAIRSYITYVTGTQKEPGNPIYLTSILGYGAYAVIEHKAGDTAPADWSDIVYNDKAIKFEKSYTEGDEKISHTSNAGNNRRYTVMFDFYDMLYTYRMAENVYWVTYYEDAEGIHFTSVKSESLSGLIDTIKAQGKAPAAEEAVLDDMKALHKSLIEYRGADADIGNTDYPDPITLKDSGLMDVNFSTSSYQYGRRHQIRLIEPWGFKVTLRVKDIANDKILDLTSGEIQDVGMIFYHDKVNKYFNSGMGSADMLNCEDAVVFSKSLGNLFSVKGDSAIAVYDKGIYTYQLDTELYCLPFVKVNGQYYCLKSAIRWNVHNEMTTFRDDETRKILERNVFEDMINLYKDVQAYLYPTVSTKD